MPIFKKRVSSVATGNGYAIEEEGDTVGELPTFQYPVEKHTKDRLNVKKKSWTKKFRTTLIRAMAKEAPKPEAAASSAEEGQKVKITRRASPATPVFVIGLQIISILSFLSDVGSDVYLIFVYAWGYHYWWCSLTSLFVLLPCIVTFFLYFLTPPRRFCLSLFKAFHLDMIKKTFQNVKQGCLTRRGKAKSTAVYKGTLRSMEVSEHRLFEAFLEAGPQLVLQIYVITKKTDDSTTETLIVSQVTSCLISLISLAWTLTSTQMTVILCLVNKRSDWSGGCKQVLSTLMILLWRVCTVFTRVLVFAMFTSRFQFYIAIPVIVHVGLVCLYIILDQYSKQRKQSRRFARRQSVLPEDQQLKKPAYKPYSLVSIFAFAVTNIFDPAYHTGRFFIQYTRKMFLYHYILIYLENVAMIVPWFILTPADLWYRLPAFCAALIMFIPGMVLHVIYYSCLHPVDIV